MRDDHRASDVWVGAVSGHRFPCLNIKLRAQFSRLDRQMSAALLSRCLFPEARLEEREIDFSRDAYF